jgi:hypothetical protein
VENLNGPREFCEDVKLQKDLDPSQTLEKNIQKGQFIGPITGKRRTT